ncbi:MAG: hypothetical protein QOJ00_54 [Actinomycetota bacterium]
MEPNHAAPASAMHKLELALVVAVAEVALQIAVLTARGAWSGAPLRIGFLAAKLPFCYFAWHRRPGAYLAVWLFEFGAVIAASVVHGALLPRIGFGVIAMVTMVLLGRGAGAFPPVEWRSR